MPQRVSAEAAGAETACAAHPRNRARSTCPRCGNYACSLCRTAWEDGWVCVACVDRLLKGRAKAPQEQRAHARQAVASLLLGGAGWALTLAALALLVAGLTGGGGRLALAGLALPLLVIAPFAGVIGLGLAAAAIRARGDHMIVATFGLVLSGLHVGVTLGFFFLSALRG